MNLNKFKLFSRRQPYSKLSAIIIKVEQEEKKDRDFAWPSQHQLLHFQHSLISTASILMKIFPFGLTEEAVILTQTLPRKLFWKLKLNLVIHILPTSTPVCMQGVNFIFELMYSSRPTEMGLWMFISEGPKFLTNIITEMLRKIGHDLEPVVFEESIDIGGLWRYKPYKTEDDTVMKTTIINTSKEMTAYSIFPPSPQFAPFMHNKYIFGSFLRLRHSVLDVRRAPSHEDDGKWILKYRKPPMPLPGQQHFKGKIMHAHPYKDAQTGGGFNDQIVVVVGNSGIDIFVELNCVAQQVYFATRRDTWILHRNLDHCVPFDIALNSRLHHILSSFIPKELSAWYFQRIFERRLDHEKFDLNLKSKHSILSAHLFGKVENWHLIPVIENDVNLYKFMFPSELYKHNTLDIIGLIQPLYSIMPISEMQARFFFEALTGAIKLPDGKGMWVDTERIKAEMQALVHRSHTIQVDYIPIDDLAKMVGCLPQLDKYALSDPVLFRALLFDNEEHFWAGYATIGALIIYMCVYGVGCAVPWLITGEIFPTKYRASAVTVAVTVAWSLSFVVSTCYLLFQQIVGNSISYIPFSAFGAVFVYILLPETRGKQATEIVKENRQRAKSMSIGQSPFTGAGGGGRHHKNSSRMSEEDAVIDETTGLISRFQENRLAEQSGPCHYT